MARTLVIKNADFSTNKVETISFDDSSIPCTGLSLSKNSETIESIGGTKTITATPTPSNTTDTVEWASSDNTVVSVGGGVLTAVKCGTATITATCGNQSASCVVKVTNELTFSNYFPGQGIKDSRTGRDHGIVNKTTSMQMYAALFSTTPTTYKVFNNTDGEVSGNVYPIVFGNGATKVVASVPSGMKITMWFINSEEVCDYATEHPTATYAKFISGDESAYDSSVADGDRTMDIPEGADSAIFTLYKKGSGAVITAEDVALVTIHAE